MRLLSRIIYLLGLMALFAPALAQQPVSSNTPVARVIVKFKDDGNSLRRAASLDRTKSLSTRLGFQILQGHEIATGHQVVTAKGMTSEQLAAHISKLSEVEFAEPDERRKINAITNDPIFPKQWYLQNTQASASNFSAATQWPPPQARTGPKSPKAIECELAAMSGMSSASITAMRLSSIPCRPS